jgi:Zn-dependent protease with chaperone function
MIGFPGLGLLTAYTLVLSFAAPAILRRSGWVLRAPRLAIALWQALSTAWLLSLGLIGLTLAGPLLEHLAWPAEQPAVTTAAVIGAMAGAVLATSIIARGGYVLARELARCRRERRSHAHGLAVAGELSDRLDATILDHPAPAVYCVPGPDRRGAVVVSTGALALLSDTELAAVVAHEHGHLQHHHHRVTAIAGALALAFPFAPLLRAGRREIEILAEMAADDHACRHHNPHALATALLALARAHAPEYALGAAGHNVASRLERMLRPRRPLWAPSRLAPAVSAVCVVTLPVGLACTSVIAAATAVVGRLLS